MLPIIFGALLLLPPQPAHALTINVPAVDPIIHDRKVWLVALANCESGLNPRAKVIDTNGYWSRGLYQYQMNTWLTLGKDFGATPENIFNGDLQTIVTEYVLDNPKTGGKNHWFYCSRKVERHLGAWPVQTHETDAP